MPSALDSLVVLESRIFHSIKRRRCVMACNTGSESVVVKPWAERLWPHLVISLPLLVVIAGCGSWQSGDRLPVFPASGKLAFDGRPLTGAFVVLHPKGAVSGRAAPRPHAQAAADGSFTLTSYDSNDGAAGGRLHAHRRTPLAGEARRRRDRRPQHAAGEIQPFRHIARRHPDCGGNERHCRIFKSGNEFRFEHFPIVKHFHAENLP